MNHTEKMTRYTANFIDELVCSGLRHVVISPGSRSTPLAMLCTEHKQINEWVLIDERSAAYFALGMAKKTKMPVAIVCTSGTAAANYLPAIVEAYYARVPLIVLTADRPHELRDIGAPQTINQLNMYGQFVKEFQEMAPPESSPETLRYVRSRAARAIRIAVQGTPGPVHFNFPFREPLIPNLTLDNLWGNRVNTGYNFTYEGAKQLDNSQLMMLLEKINGKEKGLLVCGPQVNEQLGEKMTALAHKLQVPILADPLSQLRSGTHDKDTIICTYDTIFRSKSIREQLKPDYIIRFGAMPISKNYLFFVQENDSALQVVVEDDKAIREPTNHHSEYIFADSIRFCEDFLLLLNDKNKNSNWLNKWKKMNAIVEHELAVITSTPITEGEAVRTVVETIPNRSELFIGNSMPVRDLDTFFLTTDKQIIAHGNRGVSGIDGTVSSAIGVAATTNKPVTLIIGDLSFYHDLNSLLAAKHYNIDLTIVLINNNGGGIFSFLPQVNEKKHFEALFGTPLDIEFKKVVSMYGGTYELIQSSEQLAAALQQSYGQGGLHVLEVQTDRAENVKWHRELWENINERLSEDEGD